MPDTTTRAQEIRAELDKLAPYSHEGPVTAEALVRYLLTEAQKVWARNVTPFVTPREQDAALLTGYYAAAHALYVLSRGDLIVADQVARRIRDAWEDGANMGEWVWEHLGDDVDTIAKLAQELAEVTVKPAVQPGVAVAPEDLRAFLDDPGMTTEASQVAYERLRALVGES